MTSFAVLGPTLTTEIVHKTVSLTLILLALTRFTTTKSQIGFAKVVLLALLLDLLESGVVLLTITTFVTFLSAVTLVAKVRTIRSLTFKSPIFQTIFLPLC